jgi:hypothetical protein
MSRKPISALMAVCFCLAAGASPALVIHEAVGHAAGHHHDDAPGFTPTINLAHHAHDGHEHSMLSAASVATRGAHKARAGVVPPVTTAPIPGYHADVPVLARSISRPPRPRHPHSVTAVLRI